MATNPYVNKVELADGTVLMDSTGTTVTPDKLMNGTTALDKTGAVITGTLTTDSIFVAEHGTTTVAELEQALSDGKLMVCHAIYNNIDVYLPLIEDYEYEYGGSTYHNLMFGTGFAEGAFLYCSIDTNNGSWSNVNYVDYIPGAVIIDYGATGAINVINQAVQNNRTVFVKVTTHGDYDTYDYAPLVDVDAGGTGYTFSRIADGTVYEYIASPSNVWSTKTSSYYTKTETDALLNDKVNLTDAATDSKYGLVKLNSNESITLNSSGQLDVGGRLGQMNNSTGVYSPKSINPSFIGNGSFLLTEASGTTLGNKSLAVSTGSALSLKTTAAAGATQYRVSNTYENRIICAGIVGGILALNESSAATKTVQVTGVKINGADFTPDSSSTSSTNDIVITTNGTVNPSSSTSSVRPYSKEDGFSNLFVGQQVGSGNTGASVIVGQKVFSASGNACALVGASIYNSGNGNAVFGRQHISKKNRSLLAGTGHDTSNAKSESVAAVGQWSAINSNTLFAVGNGNNAVDRKNAFEVVSDGIILLSSNGTKYKLSINNSGEVVVSSVS